MTSPSIQHNPNDQDPERKGSFEWVDDSPSNAVCRLLTGQTSARGKVADLAGIDEAFRNEKTLKVDREDIPEVAGCDCSLALSRFALSHCSWIFTLVSL